MTEEISTLIKKTAKESGLTEAEVESQMQARKEKTHGLLSDYGALYAVAKEHGVDLTDKEVHVTPLDELTVSSSVNVVGRVKTIFNAREFTRKDGSTGRFASVVLADKKAEIRIVLWDNNTSLVKNLKIGDVVLVRNGYTKTNRDGRLEVHAGSLTNLTVNPPNLTLDLPEITEEIQDIADLTAGSPSVSLVCRVYRYYPMKEFSRQDGSTGKRASFIAEDESGRVRTVLWGKQAETKLAEGDKVKLTNAYTKKGLNDELEVHAGSQTQIKPSDAKLDLPEITRTAGELKIKDVKAEQRGITVEARIMRVYPQREFSGGTMASLVLGDESGTIRCVLWNEQSSNANDLSAGDAVRITNAYSRSNLDDEPELHVGKYSEIKADPKLDVPALEDIQGSLSLDKKIIDLEAGEDYVKITGKVVDVEDKPLLYSTCPECKSRVQNLGGTHMCDSCGMVEPTYNMVLSFILEDESSNIRVIAFREIAEKLIS
ncbi:MAG: hypothetical protein GF334_04285, partial [Candidatus Altiarchaeales archaeon]|nr:hypothetical protein [Candidatus Altiarchaeales archaeon]